MEEDLLIFSWICYLRFWKLNNLTLLTRTYADRNWDQFITYSIKYRSYGESPTNSILMNVHQIQNWFLNNFWRKRSNTGEVRNRTTVSQLKSESESESKLQHINLRYYCSLFCISTLLASMKADHANYLYDPCMTAILNDSHWRKADFTAHSRLVDAVMKLQRAFLISFIIGYTVSISGDSSQNKNSVSSTDLSSHQ